LAGFLASDPAGTGNARSSKRGSKPRGGDDMNSIFYVIGVVVVVLFILGYFGFR
jgi:hypothetical protein